MTATASDVYLTEVIRREGVEACQAVLVDGRKRGVEDATVTATGVYVVGFEAGLSLGVHLDDAERLLRAFDAAILHGDPRAIVQERNLRLGRYRLALAAVAGR